MDSTPTPRGRISYDGLIKSTFQRYDRDLATWLLDVPIVSSRAIDPNLATASTRLADKLLQVELGDGSTVYLHVEFQARGDPRMPLRMAQYVSLLFGSMERPRSELPELASFVVYLSPVEYRGDPGTFEYSGRFGVRLEVRYRVVRLWEVDPEPILAGEHPGLYPFVPLMHGNPEELVVRSKERIDALADSRVSIEGKRELLATLAGLAGRVLRNPDRVRELLGEIGKMGDNLVFDILREEGEARGLVKGREEGREEGREKGRIEEARQLVVRLLTRRFGAPDQDLIRRIDAVESIDQLESLVESAATCATLDDFRSQLA